MNALIDCRERLKPLLDHGEHRRRWRVSGYRLPTQNIFDASDFLCRLD